jgi:hypothetical protein
MEKIARAGRPAKGQQELTGEQASAGSRRLQTKRKRKVELPSKIQSAASHNEQKKGNTSRMMA